LNNTLFYKIYFFFIGKSLLLLFFKFNKTVQINTRTVKQREAKNKNLFNIYVNELTIYNKLNYTFKIKIRFNIKVQY